MKATDFYTVPKSEAGVAVPLLDSKGEDSGEWLTVIGLDSKKYAKASAVLNRELAAMNVALPANKPENAEARDMKSDELMLDYVTQLVVGWSFDDVCTPASLREFLSNAPGILYQIPNYAQDRSRFFGLASLSSTPGQT